MGVVYLAEHVALEKEVALKVLHAEAARDPTLAAQFLVEARAACRARHPGIVDVTDFGSLADGRTYLVMERIVWPTLAALLTRTLGPLPLSRALAIARNVAEALAAAAAHGVVHRDLTPTNIFVADDDRTKIADFGLARIEGHDPASQQSPGALGGTAGYMSPEQWLGERADTRSDIYSLGVVLFRTITGQMPFPTRDPLELLDQQMSAPVPMAHGEHGPVPPQVQQLLERAMAARQAERFQTVDELLLALRALEGALAPSGWTRWQ
jgi:serine/threonine-protein kinase